ncbi:MAG: hypothetical protein WBD46_16260 [Acidobacteriaceae bacterium]
MEADWAVEIGPELASIDAGWDGWIDLRSHPERVGEIAEAEERPALRGALLLLNRTESPVFTSKCDGWPLAAGEIDPLEFEAAPEECGSGVAGYVDVLACDAAVFRSFAQHEAWARQTALELRGVARQRARVDLVVRAAAFRGEDGFGITLYAAGCGRDTRTAEAAWGAALQAAAAATIRVAGSFAAFGISPAGSEARKTAQPAGE